MPISPRHTLSKGRPVAQRQFADRDDSLSRDYKEEQLSPVKTPQEQESTQRQVAAADHQVDSQAHEL